VSSPGEPYQDFAAWLDGRLAVPMPPAVVAFSLNLYEGNDSFDVQLSGASSFDPEDETWACNPVYADEENLFRIARGLVLDDWEAALDLVLLCMERYLREGERSAVLRASRGVGVGFVDGDLHVIWPRGRSSGEPG
jgi:hypothetical protein